MTIKTLLVYAATLWLLSSPATADAKRRRTSTPTRTRTPTQTLTRTPSPTRTPVACPQYILTWTGDEALANGNTSGADNQVRLSNCGDGGSTSPEQTYLFTVPANGDYDILVYNANWPVLVSVHDTNCAGTEIACQVGQPRGILVGQNGHVDTTAQGDDVQIITPGDPALIDPTAMEIGVGPNGLLDTVPAGDDTILRIDIPLTLTAGQQITIVVDGIGGASGSFTVNDPIRR